MSFNYKQQVIASELVAQLGILLSPLATKYTEVTDPVVLVGTGLSGSVSASIRIQDQRGSSDAGWDNIIGTLQEVYTSGVCQILTEAQGPVGVAPVQASATATLATVVATNTITVDGIALTATAGTQDTTNFVVGGSDTVTAANIVTTIKANTTLNKYVTASSVAGVVTVKAMAPGPLGNKITLAGTAVRFVVSSGTLVGGAGGPASSFLPFANFLPIVGLLGKAGYRVEFYQVAAGTDPVFANFGSASLICGFDPNPYWPLSGRV
jgi:hypothetical protein